MYVRECATKNKSNVNRSNTFSSLKSPSQDFDCCSSETKTLCPCFPVDLSGDKVFSKLSVNRTCMQFTRSHFTCRASTKWGEQFNGVTSFLDASTVYEYNN